MGVVEDAGGFLASVLGFTPEQIAKYQREGFKLEGLAEAAATPVFFGWASPLSWFPEVREAVGEAVLPHRNPLPSAFGLGTVGLTPAQVVEQDENFFRQRVEEAIQVEVQAAKKAAAAAPTGGAGSGGAAASSGSAPKDLGWDLSPEVMMVLAIVVVAIVAVLAEAA